MSSRHSIVGSKEIQYSLRLVFSPAGDVRLSRGAASLAPNEREMAVNVRLPRSLFQTPSLKATITVNEDTIPNEVQLRLESAGDALRKALGCDVVFEIKPGEGS